MPISVQITLVDHPLISSYVLVNTVHCIRSIESSIQHLDLEKAWNAEENKISKKKFSNLYLVPDRIELSTEGLLDLRSTAELRDHTRWNRSKESMFPFGWIYALNKIRNSLEFVSAMVCTLMIKKEVWSTCRHRMQPTSSQTVLPHLRPMRCCL